jgi:hypothetical protein
MEKTKKKTSRKKKNKKIFGDSLGGGPMEKIKKDKKKLEKPKKNPKKQYLGTLWGEAPWRK